jgi:enoyl-CoA hydratase/carnithine racemase
MSQPLFFASRRCCCNSILLSNKRCGRSLSSTAGSAGIAAIRKRAVTKFGAPPSINTILDDTATWQQVQSAGAAIKSIGSARRVFLLDPHLTPAEMEGLAYRIRALARNEGLSAVLIATDDTNDLIAGARSRMVLNTLEAETQLVPNGASAATTSTVLPEDLYNTPLTGTGRTWHVAAGYDPLQLFQRGEHVNSDAVDYVFKSLSDLAVAVRGSVAQDTKIPIITIPHGAVTDGGFAFLLSSYVMATDETCFRILNPSRGLSFDPVGLSYMLPRLGREFSQDAAKYPGCGLILALLGYEANAEDMMETGLATNFMESASGVGPLEEALSAIPPWNQQEIIKRPIRFYGDNEEPKDHNAAYRNVAVATAVHCMSVYRADGEDMFDTTNPSGYDFIFSDPSLIVNPAPDTLERSSDLVNYAATFHSIFHLETSVAGIFNALSEVASRETKSTLEKPAEDEEGIFVARDFVRRLQSQSPLALACTFRLFWMGSNREETLESCMAREAKVQKKLLAMSDFENWARHASKIGSSSDTSSNDVAPFMGWKHKSVEEVTDDEVAEILEI